MPSGCWGKAASCCRAGGIGAMSDARWQGFYESMVDVDVLPKGLNVGDAYTMEFANKGIGRS